jgi:hypothetical protein
VNGRKLELFYTSKKKTAMMIEKKGGQDMRDVNKDPVFRINKNFESYLKMRRWTVTDVARATRYTKQQVSRTLSGSIEPSMQFLRRLSQVTGIKAGDLLETVFSKS